MLLYDLMIPPRSSGMLYDLYDCMICMMTMFLYDLMMPPAQAGMAEHREMGRR